MLVTFESAALKRHKAQAKQLWPLCRGCGTFPPALPMYSRLHQPATLWGGILRNQTGVCPQAGSELSASQPPSGAAEDPAKVCSAREQ